MKWRRWWLKLTEESTAPEKRVWPTKKILRWGGFLAPPTQSLYVMRQP